MRILFKTLQKPKSQLRMDEQADYMSDLLFHGLRSLYGEDCVDVPKKDYMYDTFPKENTQGLWGRGFTYSRTLKDIPLNRDVSPKDFDFVIFSIHHSLQFEYNHQLREFYNLDFPIDRMAVVDGHDWPQYNKKLGHVAPNYFKRELDDTCPKHFKPIWFAIPKSKIVRRFPEKKRDFARIYPGSAEPHWPKDSRKSHNFTEEDEYYKEYQESKFAFTCKKGGWDCMRHMEIIANGCVPIFTDVEDCPPLTCKGFNKDVLSMVKTMDGLNLPVEQRCYHGHKAKFGEESWSGTESDYMWFLRYLLAEVKRCGHTEYLAKYVMEHFNAN